jgi:predicted nuclease of predicted toxin-antitoxin system
MKLLVDMNLPPRWVETLTHALRQMAASLADGALLTIDPIHARLRILPLGQK